jgi:hypothetical protein
MAYPSLFFVAGLVAATAAYGTAYLTQFALCNEDLLRPPFLGAKHQVWLALTFLIACASLAFFGVGAFTSILCLRIRSEGGAA